MQLLQSRGFHLNRNACFLEQGGCEVVDTYGDVRSEYEALGTAVGVIDLSYRGRICMAGQDRRRFLNGQVTNDVGGLKTGSGCYAALVTAKGKMVSDLNIYCLENELLLDFEPGFSALVVDRFEKYIIADDVEVVNVADEYGLWSIQGPRALSILQGLELGLAPREKQYELSSVNHEAFGEICLVTQPRFSAHGFDLYVPARSMEAMGERLERELKAVEGRFCGWQALEMRRIEAGIPRFGFDMDDTHLPQEAGLENRAISYSKGCYTGQEVIARIRTYGRIAKSLKGIRMTDPTAPLPIRGDKLFHAGREAGSITSALDSPSIGAKIALAYVRRDCGSVGEELTVRTGDAERTVRIVELPFVPAG